MTEFEKKEYIGKTALGIYAFDGDNLKWCSNEPGGAGRPKAFPAKVGSAQKKGEPLYVVFTKVK